MKRRGFLGILGGAAVAGPSMAKAALTTIADTSVVGLSGGVPVPDWGAPGYASPGIPVSDSSWQIGRLAKLIARTAEQHDWHRRRTAVQSLDPDLAVNRSMALHMKIAIQRDRNYARGLEYERSDLEAQIAGWFN